MDVQLVVTIFLISFATYKLTCAQMIEPPPQINEYYTSVIQPDTLQNDQQAQGAVNVNFSPNNLEYFRLENRDVAFGNPYDTLTIPVDGSVSQDQPTEFDAPKALGLRMVPNQSPSQSFNVGYSVKFGKIPPRLRQIPKEQQIFINSDIITGRNKEEVMKPVNVNPVSEEFVLNAYGSSKKRKISGDKPKNHKPTPSSFVSKKLPTYPHVSSETQIKMQPFEPDYASNTYSKKANNSPWRILSPGVEIYKSKPLTAITSESMEESKGFDHAKALGRSIGFDYTNVVDPNPYTYEPDESYRRKPAENQKYYNYISPNGNQEKIVSEIQPLALTLIRNPNTNGNINHPTSQRLNVDFPSPQQDGTEQYENVAANDEENMSYFPENYQNSFKTFSRSESKQNFNSNSEYTIPQRLNVELLQQDDAEHRGNAEAADKSHYFSASNYKNDVKTPGSAPAVVETRFLEQNTNPILPAFRQKHVDQQFPLDDVTNYSPLQKYVNYGVKTIKTGTPMYSVTESLQENSHFAQLPNNYNKSPSRNMFYIPHNHRFYSGIKRNRPTSFRYSKEPRKYARPHARNRAQSRIH